MTTGSDYARCSHHEVGMADSKIAGIARLLAEALSNFARSRGDDDRKRIAQLQTELCAACRAEIEEVK